MNFRDIEYGFSLAFKFFSNAFSITEFKRFLRDNRGVLVLSFDEIHIPDKGWLDYKRLEVDQSVKSISPNDLPKEFCPKACKLVDEFHRKTVNEDIEWMLYFDYTNGEVIYCWKGEKGKAKGDFENIHVCNRKIASIHNHPQGFYSFPSPDNFDILENVHEDYEIITSYSAFWIVKFKGKIAKEYRKLFQQFLGGDMGRIISIIRTNCPKYDIDNITEDVIGNYLMNEIDKEIQCIDLLLVKKEFD